jgi:hypothetical protein
VVVAPTGNPSESALFGRPQLWSIPAGAFVESGGRGRHHGLSEEIEIQNSTEE